ncbi:hypothetical protein Tco_0734884 [Tanacetum coccineum]
MATRSKSGGLYLFDLPVIQNKGCSHLFSKENLPSGKFSSRPSNDEGRVSPYDDGTVQSSQDCEDDSATSMGDKTTFSEGNVGINSIFESISFDLNSLGVSN